MDKPQHWKDQPGKATICGLIAYGLTILGGLSFGSIISVLPLT